MLGFLLKWKRADFLNFMLGVPLKNGAMLRIVGDDGFGGGIADF